MAHLGDFNGDGDLDLAALWESPNWYKQSRGTGPVQGWLVLDNDGTGAFAGPVALEHFPAVAGRVYMASLSAAELDGEAPPEIVVDCWRNVQVLSYRPDEGWVVIYERPGAFQLGPDDSDGDGDVDLWILDYCDTRDVVLLNDAQAHFVEDAALAAGLTDAVRQPWRQRDDELTPWATRRQTAVSWYDRGRRLRGRSVGCDVNGDGHLDPVFVDGALRSPAVVVGVAHEDGTTVLDGRYPVVTPGWLVSGDVDGDGDDDLVVLHHSAEDGESGVSVLLSRLDPEITAVSSLDHEVIPMGVTLGSAYPNPFSPRTWIPLTVPANAGPVRVTVHNLLGQPICTLVSGLTPGYHAVPWDGLDETGQAISSGVYLYQLATGSNESTGKVTRSR